MYLYFTVLVVPAFWSIMLVCASAWYVGVAYVPRWSKASQSCFFMPCAPQSINEKDQLFALFAGLVLLLGWEVIPVLTAEFSKRYRDRQEFVQHMEEHMKQLVMEGALRRMEWRVPQSSRAREQENEDSSIDN